MDPSGTSSFLSKCKFIADAVINYDRPVYTTTDSFYITDVLADGTYYYAIKAVDEAGNVSPYRIRKIVARGAPSPLDKVNYSFIPSGDTASIYLYWDASSESDINRYNIYCNTGSGDINYASPTGYILAPGTSWTSDVLPSGNWKFNVRCVDASGFEEVNFKNEISCTVDNTSGKPAPPTSVTATPIANGDMRIRWKTSTSSDIKKYTIYKGIYASGITYASGIDISKPSYPVTYMSHDISGLTEGIMWGFVVRATNEAGVQETNTNIASGIPDSTAPSGVSSITATETRGGRVVSI